MGAGACCCCRGDLLLWWQLLAWTDAFNLDVAGLTNLLEDLDTLQV